MCTESDAADMFVCAAVRHAVSAVYIRAMRGRCPDVLLMPVRKVLPRVAQEQKSDTESFMSLCLTKTFITRTFSHQRRSKSIIPDDLNQVLLR